MAGEDNNSQGAGLEHLSDGQTSGAGAPKKPVVPNGPIPNANGSGDGVVPKEDEAAKAAAKAKEDEAAAKKAEEDQDEDEPVVTEYATWEDPSAQAAVELLKEAGVTPAEAAGIFDEAVKNNDPRLIDVKKLEAKVGKAKALLIMNGVQDYHRRTTVEHEKTVQEVKQVFGGDQGWETVKTWAQAREKVDPAFKKELDDIRADLNKGGRTARAAAKDLLAVYNGDSNTKGLGAVTQKLVKGDGTPAPVGGPLSRADYNTELKKAYANGATKAVIDQLNARRQAGMKAGI
ncbi:putative scaffolding protein [Rhizobium phage RHEph15]|uniref:Putative scaffolding protein n=1 Tax=Rhizobium phage RHph_TM34 TaxID=2509556 RepID=A0A7S5R804_9CAUD|nr:putative scaffolding protein [Rhizobium phage RHph_TM34]QXV74295.1 putative scaffolding protein [Rhizobium phage RHEph15]QXV74989.1 putative scaffolding protein [Rhizobium phage RHEph27]